MGVMHILAAQDEQPALYVYLSSHKSSVSNQNELPVRYLMASSTYWQHSMNNQPSMYSQPSMCKSLPIASSACLTRMFCQTNK
jgi:hypothetical protein